MTVFAHISDIHVDGGARAAERTARVLEYLNTLPGALDALLITGDLADHGLADEYTEIRALLKESRVPMLSCPGNHDVRAAYRSHLLDLPGDDAPINQAHLAGGALFAMCDSSVPGAGQGLLSDDTLAWLDATLTERSDTPAFVCFHHPPTMLHVPSVDAIRQFQADRLSTVLARHPQVVAILCGHAHTAAATTFSGLPLLVAPGVASTLRLPWDGSETIDRSLPPAVAFHVLDDERRLTTHYRVVP